MNRRFAATRGFALQKCRTFSSARAGYQCPRLAYCWRSPMRRTKIRDTDKTLPSVYWRCCTHPGNLRRKSRTHTGPGFDSPFRYWFQEQGTDVETQTRPGFPSSFPWVARPQVESARVPHVALRIWRWSPGSKAENRTLPLT